MHPRNLFNAEAVQCKLDTIMAANNHPKDVSRGCH